VGNIIQPWLSKLQGVKVVEKRRKLPQPQVRRFRPIKKYELLHRPFDLRFRGQLNSWLGKVQKQHNFSLDRILDDYQLRIVGLYFFPQPPKNKWLNQTEVIERVGQVSKKKLRAEFVRSLIRIWQACHSLLFMVGYLLPHVRSFWLCR
jgi:hypothetical protein